MPVLVPSIAFVPPVPNCALRKSTKFAICCVCFAMGVLSMLRPFTSCEEEDQRVAVCLSPWGGTCSVLAEGAFKEPLYCIPEDYDAWFAVLSFCCFAVRPVLRYIGCVSGYSSGCNFVDVELEACVRREVRRGVWGPAYPGKHHEQGCRWSCHLLPRAACCGELG